MYACTWHQLMMHSYKRPPLSVVAKMRACHTHTHTRTHTHTGTEMPSI